MRFGVGHGARSSSSLSPDGKQRTYRKSMFASCARDVFQAVFSPLPGYMLAGLRLALLETWHRRLPDAYRGHPVDEQHLRYSVVAIWVPKEGWKFTILWGLAYGLEAAVVAFNRMPILGIAACRRMVSSAAAAYFDDELSLEFIRDTDVSQSGLHLVFGLMGSPPQAQKRFWAAVDRCYLGRIRSRWLGSQPWHRSSATQSIFHLQGPRQD